MKKSRFFSLIALALVGIAMLASGCGSSNPSVSANDVAVVGDQVISKDQFDRLLNQARQSYKSQGQKFPQAGTQQYVALRRQAMRFLVQRAEFELKAKELGVKITDADVENQLTKVKAQYFGSTAPGAPRSAPAANGKCDAKCEQKYRTAIKRQGLTDAQVREDIRASVAQNKLYDKVTADIKVSDKEIAAHYKRAKKQYIQPESREVRHILVKKKALADRLYQQLVGGADFAKLAKRYSEDPSSKSQGGKLLLSKGRQVPEFDKAAFSLKLREISKPVKTTYGWHIIQALGSVKKGITTPIAQVRAAISQQLLQQKKQVKMRDWVAGITKEFGSKTTYQVGYAPPQSSGATATQ